MSSERRQRRTRIVPRLIFQTATLVPALAACGGDVSEQSDGGRDAAADRAATGGTGNRPGTGGSGGTGGYIVLALGGFGGSVNTDAGPVDASVDASDANIGGTGGVWVLAMNGFGGGGGGSSKKGDG
jgi:hypothetical protein